MPERQPITGPASIDRCSSVVAVCGNKVWGPAPFGDYRLRTLFTWRCELSIPQVCNFCTWVWRGVTFADENLRVLLLDVSTSGRSILFLSLSRDQRWIPTSESHDIKKLQAEIPILHPSSDPKRNAPCTPPIQRGMSTRPTQSSLQPRLLSAGAVPPNTTLPRSTLTP